MSRGLSWRRLQEQAVNAGCREIPLPLDVPPTRPRACRENFAFASPIHKPGSGREPIQFAQPWIAGSSAGRREFPLSPDALRFVRPIRNRSKTKTALVAETIGSNRSRTCRRAARKRTAAWPDARPSSPNPRRDSTAVLRRSTGAMVRLRTARTVGREIFSSRRAARWRSR